MILTLAATVNLKHKFYLHWTRQPEASKQLCHFPLQQSSKRKICPAFHLWLCIPKIVESWLGVVPANYWFDQPGQSGTPLLMNRSEPELRILQPGSSSKTGFAWLPREKEKLWRQLDSPIYYRKGTISMRWKRHLVWTQIYLEWCFFGRHEWRQGCPPSTFQWEKKLTDPSIQFQSTRSWLYYWEDTSHRVFRSRGERNLIWRKKVVIDPNFRWNKLLLKRC